MQNRSVSDVASQQSHFSPSPEVADPTAERIARTKALIELGHVGRAARSLLQAPLPPVNERVVNDLQALHPPSSAPSPHLPPDSPTLQLVDTDILARLIRSSLANGSSPGPSGWTGDLLLALIDDHDCLIGLGTLVKDIINGSLTGAARDLLVSSTLIATKKSSGGFRSIAMGESFYMLACLYTFSLVRLQNP